MFGQWIDPEAFGIVFLGTLAATMLRCGPRDAGAALAALAGLCRRPFDASRTKAELSGQVRSIADDGFLRAEPRRTGDEEFDALSDILVSRRSIAALHDEHEQFRENRRLAATVACRTFDAAAELAPVLGLAGTLVALGQAPAAAPGVDGLVAAIGMAVATTLYGLVAANFVFAPLGAAVARRAQQEERGRDEVLRWLAQGLRKIGGPVAVSAPPERVAA